MVPPDDRRSAAAACGARIWRHRPLPQRTTGRRRPWPFPSLTPISTEEGEEQARRRRRLDLKLALRAPPSPPSPPPRDDSDEEYDDIPILEEGSGSEAAAIPNNDGPLKLPPPQAPFPIARNEEEDAAILMAGLACSEVENEPLVPILMSGMAGLVYARSYREEAVMLDAGYAQFELMTAADGIAQATDDTVLAASIVKHQGTIFLACTRSSQLGRRRRGAGHGKPTRPGRSMWWCVLRSPFALELASSRVFS